MLDWLLPATLAALMLAVGMSVTWHDLIHTARNGRALAGTLISMQLLLPAIVLLIASTLRLSAPVAVGMVLLASCPGGMFSNYVTHLGGGNVAMSIALTVLVTLVYAFTAPMWAGLALHTLAGGTVVKAGYSSLTVLRSLATFVLVPVVLGVTARSCWPALVTRAAPWVREPAAVALLVCYGLVLYGSRETLAVGFGAALLPVLCFNTLCLGACLLLTRWLRVSDTDALPIRVEHLIRQEGTGVYLAAVLIGNAPMTYPMLVNSLTGLIAALTLAMLGRRHRLSLVRSAF